MSESTEQVTPSAGFYPESANEGREGETTPVEGLPPQHDADDGPSEAMQYLRELVETVVLALIMFLIIRQGIQNYRIESHSMEPNFYEDQFVLVNKLAYRLGEPARGDVVVFNNPANPKEDYIKRIIGLPGDTVEFADGTAYVNGLPLDEPYVRPPTYGAVSSAPVLVPADHIFVMGDNRPNSRDSRAFGPLTEDLIVGRAWLRVWPFSEWGTVGHVDLIPGEPFLPDSLPN
jgi:signal peptidase I